MNRGLSSSEEKKLQEYLNKKQENEVMLSYLNLTKSCFDSCVNDFTSSSISPKEDKCISLCVKKFLSATERINAKFQEENMKMQGGMN
ncbi:hypothetical protein K502DRAFT_366712 [Neoconidiobolus thromboides FSU 785]|nr:hypothetical protein K502DRAFT_366712 [Neoconidiobolus thromboides FSU 785]